MTVRLLPAAQAELDEAIRWYAMQATGLVIVAVAHHHRKPAYWQTRQTP